MKQIEEYVDQIDNTQGRIELHNILMHFQADCFDHAAGLVDEAVSQDASPLALGTMLRQHAKAVCPGFQCQSERVMSPPAATPVLTGQDFGGTMPQAEPPADYVPESPESST